MGTRGYRRQAARAYDLPRAWNTGRRRAGRDGGQDLPHRTLRLLRCLRHHRHDSGHRAGAGVPRLPRGAWQGCRRRPEGLLEEWGEGLRVLVPEKLADPGIELLEQDFEVDVLLDLSPKELLQKIGDYDGLIIRSATKVTAQVIERAGNLKAIGRAGIGVDNIDIEAATKRGIIVANAPESNTVAAAEHTLGLMLAVARRIPAADSSLRGGEWKRSVLKGVEVSGKTIGLVGLGHVGAIVARGALGMGMQVLAFDPYVSEDRMRSMNVGRAQTADEVFERADFVSLHVPRTNQTMGLVNEGALAKMKRSAYLINVARGGIVDETALYNALKEGEIAGAALDVFAEEPTTDSPIFTLPNVVVTPHLGASTAEAQDRAGITAAEQVATALRIEYHGEVAGFDTRLLDVSAQKGLLAPMVFEPLNFVNTPALAKERGLKVETSRTSESADYTNLVELRMGENTVSGTLFGPRMQPRLVGAMGFDFDVVPEKHMLFIRNEDRPGMIGRLGGILGEHGINIGNMAVGRGEPGSRAAMAVTVDEPVPEEVLKALEQTPGFNDARSVTL